MALGDHVWYYDHGYEGAKADLLMLLAKRQVSHPHNLVGDYACLPCMTGQLTIMLAWLGVDTDLNPIDETETKAGTK